MKKRLIEALATGLYVGKMPILPGTFGTLWGVPLAWWLWQRGPLSYILTTVVLILVAIAIAEWHELLTGRHDHGSVVIDEIVGYLVAVTWLPFTWQAFVAAFVVFRFFDMVKPFPISYLDRRIRGGLGCVLDDVAAGLISNFILQIVYAETNWLGVQLHVLGS